jgi:hypothetical protein
MATSGTLGMEVLDVTSVIEHAARRCGVLATMLTSEMLTSARENLGLILSTFVTKGMQLWCTTKTVYPLNQGAAFLLLNPGTVDVVNALIRSGTYAAGTLATGQALYSPAAPVLVNAVSLDLPAGAYQFVLESSPDAAAWTVQAAYSVTLQAAGRAGFDAETFVTAAFWRVREVLSGTVHMTAATFITAASEIPMAKLNRDDYANLPNKAFSAQQALQFWYDKQYYQPRMWLWPVPQDSDHQAVVWSQNQVQDVGDLSNQLQVPQRWMDAVIFELSTRVCLELPKELVPPDRYSTLSTRAEMALKDVMDAETDGSPVRLAPNIRAYTR